MGTMRFPKLPSGLTPEQKVASVLLVLLGLGGIVLGFLSFGANIRRPFELRLAAAPKGFELESQRLAREEEESKARDTDGDGLSDYDELQVFRTSPYLKDTDSDGFDDKQEAFSGNDPNCPAGKTCGTALSSEGASAPAAAMPAAPTLPSVPTTLDGLATSGSAAGTGFKTEADVATYLKSLSIAQVRSVLAQSGASADQLNGMTDDAARAVFEKAVDAALASGQFKALVTAQP